jgi:hypothetical protein
MSEAREIIVNDVTRLNPVPVRAVVTPVSVEEVVEIVRKTTGPLSVGGGHFSMGGQTASPGSLHLDMRRLNKVVWFSPLAKAIRVQSGVRWCDIQKFGGPAGVVGQNHADLRQLHGRRLAERQRARALRRARAPHPVGARNPRGADWTGGSSKRAPTRIRRSSTAPSAATAA